VIELAHKEFFPYVEQTDFSIGEWTAVCFLLLDKDRLNLNLPVDEIKQLVELVKDVFTNFKEGFFIQLGWTSYLACIKSDKGSVTLGFEKSVAELGQTNKHCQLWIYNIVNINGDSVRVIRELEWKTHKGIKL